MRTLPIIMIAKIHFILILIISLSHGLHSQEQSDTLPSIIITDDGNQYVGIIVFEDTEILSIRTKHLGEITIRKSHIKKRSVVRKHQLRDGEIWSENPQSTRYFWAPNGYGVKKGEGYYQNVWVLFNQFVYGVSDRFSFGAGTVPLFLLGGTATPFWITPKFSIPVKKDRFNLGAGALLGTIIGEDGEGGFGIVYGTSTFGSRDKNLSLGLGYGYAGGEWANAPIINLSGMTRVGRRGYVLTENYLINLDGDLGMLMSIGGRSILGKIGLDYGGIVPIALGTETFIAFPWLGLTIPFGK